MILSRAHPLPALAFVFALLLGGATNFSAATDTEPRWQTLNRSAKEAVDAKDYAKLREVLRELQTLMPGNPRIAYKLATAETKLGNRVAALAALHNLAQAGLVYDFAADADFSALQDLGEFATIVKRVNDNRKPLTHSRPAFVLTEPDLIPEDIAYDARAQRFLIASVTRSKIITADGRDFARTELPAMALRIDAARKLVWVATAWLPHCAECNKADENKSLLLALDLATGTLKQRIESPVKGVLGDMTIGRNGDLYVSEGSNGAVLRLRQGESQLVRLDTPGEFPSPQTPALSADEKILYVPDYVRGIAAITLATGKVTWLMPADHVFTSGIDGLYVYRDSFIAVQNGTTPPRVMRFSLDLKKQQVLEANAPGLGEPTHGTFAGNNFYFIANSGWGDFDDAGKKKPGSAPVKSSVRKMALSATLP